MSIVEQLKAARRFRHITARELAVRAGVSAVYISQLEHGRYRPTSETIERLAAALDMDVRIIPKSL